MIFCRPEFGAATHSRLLLKIMMTANINIDEMIEALS